MGKKMKNDEGDKIKLLEAKIAELNAKVDSSSYKA